MKLHIHDIASSIDFSGEIFSVFVLFRRTFGRDPEVERHVRYNCIFYSAICVTACPANCLQCGDPNNNGVMVCSQCNSQFVLNPGDCGACPRYCSNCTFANGGLTCNTCGPRSVMQSGNGTCLGKTKSVIYSNLILRLLLCQFFEVRCLKVVSFSSKILLKFNFFLC